MWLQSLSWCLQKQTTQTPRQPLRPLLQPGLPRRANNARLPARKPCPPGVSLLSPLARGVGPEYLINSSMGSVLGLVAWRLYPRLSARPKGLTSQKAMCITRGKNPAHCSPSRAARDPCHRKTAAVNSLSPVSCVTRGTGSSHCPSLSAARRHRFAGAASCTRQAVPP